MKNLSIIEQPYTEKDAKKKKDILSEINALGKTKEELDAVVSRHEAQKKTYKDLDISIKKRESEIEDLNSKITALLVEKKKIEQENKELEIVRAQKDVLLNDMESMKPVIQGLKSDISVLTDRKNKLEGSTNVRIQEMKNQVVAIKLGCDSIISELG